MKKLIKIVAMLSFMFLFTGCNPVDEILESEKFKNLVDEKIKSEIDMQLNKFPNNEELEKLIASNISQAKEIDNLKLKVDTLESNIKNLENKTKEQSEKVKNMFN